MWRRGGVKCTLSSQAPAMTSLSKATSEDRDCPKGMWHCLHGLHTFFSQESVCFLEFLLGLLGSHSAFRSGASPRVDVCTEVSSQPTQSFGDGCVWRPLLTWFFSSYRGTFFDTQGLAFSFPV